MKTTAVVYMTHQLAFDHFGGQTLGERFVKTLLEVRNIDTIMVVMASPAREDLRYWTDDMGCCVKQFGSGTWDESPELTDAMCIDSFGHCLDGETAAPETLVACVPYMPFLSSGAVELCVRKLSNYLWAGPSQTLPAVIPHVKGGTRRTPVGGYLACVRVFKAALRNEARPWDNTFGGVNVDAIESLNVIRPADRKLADALLAG